MTGPRPPQKEREKLFQRMHWVFVYAPPILALFFGLFGAVFLAILIPSDTIGFWGRWAIALLVILGLPAIVYFVRSWLTRN